MGLLTLYATIFILQRALLTVLLFRYTLIQPIGDPFHSPILNEDTDY